MLRNWRIHCGGYSHISVLGFQHQISNPFYLSNIASIYLFRFIITYLFLNIFVWFLFGCCRFQQHNEVWFQFISVTRVLKYIGLILYIHCVPISNNHPNFYLLHCYIFSIKFDFSYYILCEQFYWAEFGFIW